MGSQKISRSYTCHIATSNSVKQHKLRKRIAWLSNKEGWKTEFVSVYIPSSSSIDNIIFDLKKEEKLTKTDDERVNDRLQQAIKATIKKLKQRKEIPDNGLAIFAGTIAEDVQENEVLFVEDIIPPEPLVTYVFEANHHFHLEPLREMLRNPRIVGFISMDSKEASFGLLNGELFDVVKNISSGIAGKSGKGGQSQRRYERERDMELTFFFHRVADYATKEFLKKEKVMAIVVGGPSTTKNTFVNGDYLHYELKEALLSVVDTQSAGKEGLNELLDKSSETIKNLCLPVEKQAVHRFFQELNKPKGLVAYGLKTVLGALNKGAAETVIVVDNSDFTELVLTCKKCGNSKKKIVINEKKSKATQELISTACKHCNSMEYELEEKDIIDVLEDLASKTDAKVEVIHTDSIEKEQITKLGGIAALLRYPA
ncbi:MAG: peptide chain release factor aRF-1 [Candidatus Bathyarchaeota archaeon]